MSDPRGGIVDWGLAERVGRAIAATGAEPASVPAAEVTRAAERARGLVADYTRLVPREAVPHAETVDRREWVGANLASFRRMSEEAERRLAEALRAPEPIGGAVRRVARPVAGAQLGLAVGYVGRKVLGQYDVALIGPRRPPRLLFVGPNLAVAHRRLGEPRELFLTWIAAHELTHAFQFEAVPWLRGYLGGIVDELLEETTLATDLSELRRVLRRLLPPRPDRIVEQLREGGVVRLLAGPEQRRSIERLQAAMTVIEGYCEHVMDAIGARLDPGYARLRAAADAERQRRGTLEAIVATLLGLGMKLRQYELGKRFADRVVERAGIDGLNAVWRSPAALPGRDEIERPERWLDRVVGRSGSCNRAARVE
jgi:coenzyme F420 biosynthesis associated uncharacterized protein